MTTTKRAGSSHERQHPQADTPLPASSPGALAHDRRQRGGGPGGLPAQRGDRHLPDHPRHADGGGLRQLERRRPGQPLGHGAVGGAAAKRGRGGRQCPWCPPGRLPRHQLHGLPGAAADGAGALQAGRRTHPRGHPRGVPGPGGPGALDLRRPQRCDGLPRHRLRHPLRRLGAGGRRLRRHRHPGQPGESPAVSACLRRLPHLPRDPKNRAPQRCPAAGLHPQRPD